MFSPPLFVLMIDPLIKIGKNRVGDRVEVLFFMGDPNASSASFETAWTIHSVAKKSLALSGW